MRVDHAPRQVPRPHRCRVAARQPRRLIAAGRVTVGREVVTDPARDVDGSEPVAVDRRVVGAPAERLVYAVNKPAGVVSTAKDTHGRPTVVELVPADRRLYPVGRLDADTTGLILLTDDGDLAHHLTHPQPRGSQDLQGAGRRRAGARACAARVAHRRGPGGRRHRSCSGDPAPSRGARDRLHEGRKRQVRRMCEAVGHPVIPWSGPPSAASTWVGCAAARTGV